MMERQRTLIKSFTLDGNGLHSAHPVSVTFHPAPVGHGYKIRRTDLPGQPVINAVAENVVSSLRGTVLSENGVMVASAEHALAALYGCEIDNCLIDIDSVEFPSLDGSAIQYVSMIKKTGTVEQAAKREYIVFKRRKIKIADKERNSSIMLLPGDSFNLNVSVAYDSTFLRRQQASLENLSDFTKEIAASRTFVFVNEIEGLLQNNLIKGGNLENAVVIYDRIVPQDKMDYISYLMGSKKKDASKLGYIMNKPLLYANEPARHKLLDMLGDLALIGRFIKGRIVAQCPGHSVNTRFAMMVRENSGLSVPQQKLEAAV